MQASGSSTANLWSAGSSRILRTTPFLKMPSRIIAIPACSRGVSLLLAGAPLVPEIALVISMLLIAKGALLGAVGVTQ
jgi:hypothetical protein